MSQRRLAGGSRFAHLLGLKAGASEEDQDQDKKTTKAEEEDPTEGDDKKSKAEGDDNKKDDGDDADPNDSDKGKKGKKGKRADDDEDDASTEDGDDDSDEEDEDDEKASAARRRERARCAAIFASPHAAGRPAAAAELAFGTALPRSAAIRTLAALASTEPPAAAPARKGLKDRMSEAPAPRVGADGAERTGAAAGSFADRMKKANAIRHGES